MPTLVLRANIPPPVETSGISTRRITETKPDRSIQGVLIFSGIGFTLTMLATIFRYLELPPPYF